MSAHAPMPKSAWIFPLLAVLLFAAVTATGYGFTPSAGGIVFAIVLLVILFGTVFAAVHHAEVIAHRIGEPYGTLLLTLVRHHHRGRADRDPDARRHRGAGAGARHRVCGGHDRLQRPGRRLHLHRRPALSRAGRPDFRRQCLSQRAVHDGDHHAGAAQLYFHHAGTGLFGRPARIRQRHHHPALCGLPLHPDQPAPRFLRAASARSHRGQSADLGQGARAQRCTLARVACSRWCCWQRSSRWWSMPGPRRSARRRPLPASWWRC